MKQKLKTGIQYLLIGGYLLVVSALLLLAVNQAIFLLRPQATPTPGKLNLGLLGPALALLGLAAILFAVVFRHPRRLLAVSLLALLAFVGLDLVSGRHALPQILIWPSPRTLSERYVKALAADDQAAALRLTDGSDDCARIMAQQFQDQQSQLAKRLGDGWQDSGFRHSNAMRFSIFFKDHMPQQLVNVMVETDAGRTAWLTLKMRYGPFLGTRYICGAGIDS